MGLLSEHMYCLRYMYIIITQRTCLLIFKCLQTLLYQNRTEDDILLKDELDKLASGNSLQFRIDYYLSRGMLLDLMLHE
jgi:hypothetical protein